MRVVRTRRGLRLLEGGLVLSETLDHAGATDTLFDVLAAAIAALASGPRVAMLGFAAGGVVAPLRAMGFAHPLEAVDLDVRGEALFRHVSDAWAGEVKVAKADALEWLRRRARRYDVILEDLSIPTSLGVTKPPSTLRDLPGLIARRLAPAGVAVVNLLPIPGVRWKDAIELASAPWPRVAVIHLEEYENRVVLAGNRMASPAALSRRIRDKLRRIGSSQATLVSVRSP